MSEEQKRENGSEETLDSADVRAEGLRIPEEGAELSCEERLARKEEEVNQLNNRLLRMAAELENTRKRLEREKSEGITYANEVLIRELLPVIDNLERALQHGDRDADFQGLVEGVRMTLKGFLDSLGRFGCSPFESEGKAFDPNYHEAMMQQETDEYPENTVVQEFQKGYTLKDRLLRPALVIVSRAPDQAE
jgi:molecular chaperone GrpE